MAASVQESFIAYVSRFSLGASSLFEPDPYRKGNALREPADLAWVCRDTAVLLYMQSGNATQERQDDHNLRQAFGWLRAWRAGQPLVGQNAQRDFSINFLSTRAVLLVSVTSDPLADVLILPIDRSKLAPEISDRLMAMASVPESLLLELAQSGGSAVDLIDLLLRVASQEGRVSGKVARAQLLEQRDCSRKRALYDTRVVKPRDTDLDAWIGEALTRSIRAALMSKRDTAETQWSSTAEVFADLDWEMSATLTLRAADAFRLVRDVPADEVGPTLVALSVELLPYRILVAAYDINKQDSFGTELAEAERKFRETHFGLPTLSVHLQMVGRPEVQFVSWMLVGGDPVDYATVAESALAEVRALESSATTASGQIA